MFTEELLDEAFEMGMQQIRAEIRALGQFVADLRPRNILEIGSAQGGSFYLWCKLAAADGKKISVDLPGGVYGGEANADPEVRARRDLMMRSWASNVYLVAGDSHAQETRDQVRSILGSEQVDFLFIDGDHTYEGVRADYLMYRDFVRRFGYITFHDINESLLHQLQDVGVGRLWQELKGSRLEFNEHADWGGIGVIQHQ